MNVCSDLDKCMIGCCSMHVQTLKNACSDINECVLGC